MAVPVVAPGPMPVLVRSQMWLRASAMRVRPLCAAVIAAALVSAMTLAGAVPALAASPDGTPDTAFTTNTGTGFNGGVRAVAVQPDGKIIVGGDFTTVNDVTSNRIARLNPDGTPDTAFTTNIGTGFGGTVYSVAVQADGKIIVGGGFTTVNGATSNRIARLNPDGTPDTAFTTNIGAGLVGGEVRTVAVQADGEIVAGGYFTSVNSVSSVRIARFAADGTPDTDFTTMTGTGFASGPSPAVRSVVPQPDGTIIVGGQFTTVNNVTSNGIARLNADGSTVSSFTSNTGTGFGAPLRTCVRWRCRQTGRSSALGPSPH